jgi:hypothetical protein
MSTLNRKSTEAPNVTAKPNAGGTELGRQLRELRQKIISSGAKLHDAEEVERELALRRGERSSDDA